MPAVTCPICAKRILPGDAATLVAAERVVYHSACRPAKAAPVEPPAEGEGAPDTGTAGTEG